MSDDILGALRGARIDRAHTIMEAMVRVCRPMILREIPDPSHCIWAAWVAHRVFKRFGLDTRKIPVKVIAASPQAAPYIKRATLPSPPVLEALGGGYTLCGHRGESSEDYYCGHVVVTVSGKHVLDLTADQFTHPDLNVSVPPMFFQAEGDPFMSDGPEALDLPDGGVIVYEPNEDRSWEESDNNNDFIMGVEWGPFVEALIAAVSGETGIRL